MTSRHPLAGALLLNIPTAAAAPFLPTSSVVIMALMLAALGAVLGALVAFGLEPARTPKRSVRIEQPDVLRRAA
jgi:hypothetical protein